MEETGQRAGQWREGSEMEREEHVEHGGAHTESLTDTQHSHICTVFLAIPNKDVTTLQGT